LRITLLAAVDRLAPAVSRDQLPHAISLNDATITNLTDLIIDNLPLALLCPDYSGPEDEVSESE
jgi:hypothetical protein